MDLISQILAWVDRLQNFSKALGVPPSLMLETTPHSTSLKTPELRNFIWKFQCHKKLLMNEFLQPLGVDLAGIPTTLHLQQLTIFRSFTFELWCQCETRSSKFFLLTIHNTTLPTFKPRRCFFSNPI